MKHVKNYNEFCNEEISWKKALTSAAIGLSLNLTSCDTKKEVENKIPKVENLVRNYIKNKDENSESDNIILNKTEVRGPFDDKRFKNESLYFIISDISITTNLEIKNQYYIFVYLENKESKDGEIYATISVDNISEVEESIDYFQKYNKWPVDFTTQVK